MARRARRVGVARGAFAALPDLAGVHLGVVDNEANFCDTDCPRCRGKTMGRQLEDIYQTFADSEQAARAYAEFRIGKQAFPIAYRDPVMAAFSGRALALGTT